MLTSEPSVANEIAESDSVAPLRNEKTLKYRSCNPLVELPTALANYQADHIKLFSAGRRRPLEDENADDVDDSDATEQPLLFFNYYQVLQEPLVEPMKDASTQTDICDLTAAPALSANKPMVLEPGMQEPVPSTPSVSGNGDRHMAPGIQRVAFATAEVPPPSFTHDVSPLNQAPTQPQRNEIPQTCHTMPELRDYAWLQDMDPGDSDLLIIRVTEKGYILKPMLIFDSARWNIPNFRRILGDEEPRVPEDLIRKFTSDARGRHHFSRSSYLRSGVQFCAIVPLCPTKYKRQRRLIESKDGLFKPLNSLLGISELLYNASNEAKEWCICRSECWESGGNMILCDNMKCKIGWYHQRCAGVSEVSDSDSDSDCDYEWLCRKCARIPRRNLCIAEDMDMPYDKLAEASSNRVQQAKALDRVWRRHNWPSGKEIIGTFKMISQDMLFDPNLGFPECQYTWLRDALSRHWVTPKNIDLLDMIPVHSKGY